MKFIFSCQRPVMKRIKVRNLTQKKYLITSHQNVFYYFLLSQLPHVHLYYCIKSSRHPKSVSFVLRLVINKCMFTTITKTMKNVWNCVTFHGLRADNRARPWHWMLTFIFSPSRLYAFVFIPKEKKEKFFQPQHLV
jgi:hypothetical protein